MVVLKKKFFFFDANVDKDDPVTLHLLFVQSRDAIVSGMHPTTRSEVVELASMHCQILHGTYHPEKHKPGTVK